MSEAVEVKASNFESALNEVLAMESLLTDEQRANLSKVLFPDTHVSEVQFLGKARHLNPLTVKYARQLSNLLAPFAREMETAAEQDSKVDVDMTLAMERAVSVLAEYYKWDDVQGAIDEGDYLLSEIQSVLVQQQALQGDNDFLLGPLRILIKMMQTREILQARLQGSRQNSSTTRP